MSYFLIRITFSIVEGITFALIVEKNSMKCYDRIRYNKRNCIVLYIIFVRKLRILKFDDSVIKILCYFLHKFCMQMR